MVVEWLTFVVDRSEARAWLTIEEAVWSRFLERQPGFVRKQMWVEQEDLDRIHAVIWWNSMEEWKRIGPEVVAEVDRQMGDHLRDCTMRVFDVVRDC